MKGTELLPEGADYVCINSEQAQEYYDIVHDHALEEDLEIGETFELEMYANDGEYVCQDGQDFYPIEKDCSCGGKCTNKVPSVSVVGHATFKLINEDSDLEIIKYVSK